MRIDRNTILWALLMFLICAAAVWAQVDPAITTAAKINASYTGPVARSLVGVLGLGLGWDGYQNRHQMGRVIGEVGAGMLMLTVALFPNQTILALIG